MRVVAGPDHDDALAALHAVQAFEQPVDHLGLVAGVVSGERRTIADTVEFVDEEDRERPLHRLAEGVPHGHEEVAEVPGRLPAGERASDQRYATSGGKRPGIGGLARAGLAIEEDPAIDVAPEQTTGSPIAKVLREVDAPVGSRSHAGEFL